MRTAWRELSRRCLARAAPRASSVELHGLQVSAPRLQDSSFRLPFLGRNSLLPNHPAVRWFSAGAAGSDGIEAELASLDLSFDGEAMGLVLRDLRSAGSVSEDGSIRMDPKAFNRMLETLGTNGRPEEFWRVVEIMRKKAFGITKDTYLAVSKSFEEERRVKDADLLRKTYSLNCELSKILQEIESGEFLNKEPYKTSIILPSELDTEFLEFFTRRPGKALPFLEWVEKAAPSKINGRVYNAMAQILAQKNRRNEFQDLFHKMRDRGHELEKKTYIEISQRFCRRKMIAESVDLYEFAMGGSEKPSPQDFLFLFKNVLVGENLDFDLITRLVHSFVDAGHSFEKSVLDGVIKSLRRLDDRDKVLKAMEEGGFAADSSVHDQVVIGLSNTENQVQKYVIVGQLEQALALFKTLIEKKDGKSVGRAFEALITGFCRKERSNEAQTFLKEMATERNIRFQHSTYKRLIHKLVDQGHLGVACSIMELMKGHGFPPYIDPFIKHMSKSGTVDDAMKFLKAMTVKEFPSKNVFLRVFKALLVAGRHEVAHSVLSKSPACVRNHADVLDLFHAMKPGKAPVIAA
ncbi:pentatricopeptide repeat-containing protein At3g02490, mitochondrial-like [Curcuma longa]|uniref:pentatricopeptide repeat-containing protein At3g02490, mitochondrial-like n=1 Tax=Curcuma longa TaxID=136217 RepID=UPI003D9F3910